MNPLVIMPRLKGYFRSERSGRPYFPEYLASDPSKNQNILSQHLTIFNGGAGGTAAAPSAR